MRPRRVPMLAAGSLVALAAVSVLNAAAAANTVPPTYAGQTDTALLISQLAPPECAGMGLTVLRVGAGGSGGGNALVIGTGSSETLTGGGGDDCLVAGGGVDTLRGQGGNDVLIGGTGIINFLNGGGGTDTCYGGGWIDWPTSCETFIP